MSHAEYRAWLFGIATGWLGWSPNTALKADMSDILLAYKAKQEFVIWSNGGSGEQAMEKLTPDAFKAGMDR